MKVADAADLGGQADADVEAREELGCDPGFGQVGLVEVGAGGGGVALLAEVVDDADFIAAVDKLARDLAANEAGASGNDNALGQTTISYGAINRPSI
jgi:hypothetical protein